MKKAFLGRILGGLVAVATITSLNPLGVSAAVKNNTNDCNITTNWSKVYGTWFCLDSNGKIKLEDSLNNYIKNNKTSCNLQFGWMTNPTNTNNSVIANNESNDKTVPGVSNGSNDSKVPNTSTDNKKVDDTKVPTAPETNNGSNDSKAPNNTGNQNTTTTEKPVNKEENAPTTTGDSVNVAGLSKLPEKYSISIQSSAENKILQLMNEKRVQAGLKPLTMDNTLLQVARYKSDDMIQNNFFDHTNPDGTKWTNWLQAIGYKYTATAENIAYNTYDPVELFNQWWNSPGHKANMMNPSYTKVGVGVIYDKDNNKYMGTQTFSN
ncbi:CAP domain-containing protein [Clostridium sp. CTA-5]